MIDHAKALGFTVRKAAGRAWADLMSATAANRAEMQANYDAAKAMQDAAYDAWKAAQ